MRLLGRPARTPHTPRARPRPLAGRTTVLTLTQQEAHPQCLDSSGCATPMSARTGGERRSHHARNRRFAAAVPHTHDPFLCLPLGGVGGTALGQLGEVAANAGGPVAERGGPPVDYNFAAFPIARELVVWLATAFAGSTAPAGRRRTTSSATSATRPRPDRAATAARRRPAGSLREHVAVYAQVIHELRTELDRRTDNSTQRSPVRSLPTSIT
jgi:hypothetical protein